MSSSLSTHWRILDTAMRSSCRILLLLVYGIQSYRCASLPLYQPLSIKTERDLPERAPAWKLRGNDRLKSRNLGRKLLPFLALAQGNTKSEKGPVTLRLLTTNVDSEKFCDRKESGTSPYGQVTRSHFAQTR